MRILRGTAILRRGPGRVKIGSGPAGVLVEGLDPSDLAALRAAAGARDPRLGPAPPLSSRLVLGLRESGLIEEERAPAALRVDGLDRLCLLLIEALAEHYSLRVEVAAPARVDLGLAAELGAQSYGMPVGRVLGPALAARGAEVTVGPVPAPDLVLASFARAADAERLDDLVVDDVPHLVLVTSEQGYRIGPLVIPGRTACEHCAALAEADADPYSPLDRLAAASWPSPPVRPLALHRAVLAAADIVLAHLEAPRDGAGVRGTILDIDAHGGANARPLVAHPRCGCGADGPSFASPWSPPPP